MRFFTVSWSPADKFAAVHSEFGEDWVDRLVYVDEDFSTHAKAMAYIDVNAKDALHGHFVVVEYEEREDGFDEEISREVVER